MVKKENIAVNANRIGALLKAKREGIYKSQRDIALELGYRNINFISMIESGRSSPPLSRLPDIAKAYDLSEDFTLVMLKKLYPDSFDALRYILKCLNLKPNAEKELDGILSKLEKSYHL
jgi:transcriptional regulator with XRE-family HTH domain